ncbi:hypothetical protein [Micromonospora sagamiensis]|uniref:Uncharacterized protein n=1 Tax=Micromonospora sagamiensis TaxID=47875 RepID=A0A562WIZ7_9ACTN|nr:hypothetical protein [Micromonospora sagamiensis]TWJ30263.1 hypothetical protein JD81_03801 [Micromonospora sagamiensis]BCL16707.1 hypothetical protein GCM10017556_44460 [Micromonospora sagamiensis]
MTAQPATVATPGTTVARGRVDPIHVAAAVLITASVLWRASITTRGFLTADDFPLVAQADAGGPHPDHLFSLYNNHLMPAARLLTWVTHRLTEYEYWPYATLMLIGQVAVSVAFYRLLRLLLPTTWALLVPLCLFVFNPLTLEVTAWWAVGINLLPMQLAMIVAIGAQVRYLRTGRRRHLVTLGASVVVALLFFEKALLVVAAVFLLTLCLYAPGGPVRAVLTTVRRWWPAWLVLTGISVAYLAGYLSVSASSLRAPVSAAEVGTFLQQFYGQSLPAGLVGGPWTWLDGADGPALVAPTRPAQWASWAMVAAFAGFTVWLRRRVAVRAWLLLALYSGLGAGLIGVTRLGSGFSGVAGLVPRYLGDVLLVAALCVGVALCGLRRGEPDTSELDAAGPDGAGPEGAEPEGAAGPVPLRARPQRFVTALAVGLVLLLGSSVHSGVDFGTDWRDKAGRDYLNTARTDLATAEPGTVFMDQPVPERVVPGLSHPWNLQSRFFAPLDDDPVFVTRARRLWVFDDAGHVRPAWVKGVRAERGPAPGCGYQVRVDRPARIPLESTVVDYWQVVRIGYLSDRDTVATFRLGDGETVPFDVHRGLNAMFLLVSGGGDEVQLAVSDPAASLCTDEIEIGALVPQPVG